MRRAAVLVALGMTAASCLSQQPPTRTPLPDVADFVTPAGPCSVTVGDGSGVEIVGVVSGSPAAETLRVRDRIVSLDRRPISGLEDVRTVMTGRGVGESLDVTVRRGDREFDVTIVLGEDPATPGVGRLGVTVIPGFDELPLDRIGTTSAGGGPRSRLVEIGGELFGVDPERLSVTRWPGRVPEDPFWHGVGAVGYWVDDPTGEATLRGSDGTVASPFDGQPARVVGGVDGDLLVAVIDGATVAIRRVVPDTWTVRWDAVPDAGLGLPVAGYAADGGRLVLVMGSPETEDLRYLLMDADSGEMLGELAELAGTALFGWFDSDELLVQRPGSPLLRQPLDGSPPVAVDLAVTPTADVRVWPVGDGRHLMVESEGRLLVTDATGDDDVRPLVVRCAFGYVGQPGSGRWDS